MKHQSHLLAVSILLCLTSFFNVQAQDPADTTQSKDPKIYVVIKNDGTEFIGKILSRDAREVLILTDRLGEVYIPTHEIKEIRELKPGDMSSGGEYIPDEVFATRYFVTTNGLPIEKGESYIQWNLYGPDFQFGIAENFGLGIMTSWIGVPFIGTAKYSIPVSEKFNIGVGTLLGTGSWIDPDFGLALPFGALTFGDRRTNINFMAGYGAVFFEGENEGQTLLSISGMTKVGRKASLVFDSVIAPGSVTVLIPGVRIHLEENKAFQIGFAAAGVEGDFAPVLIPFIQWYRKM